MPIDPGEGMGKLPPPAEPDVPVLTDGPDPEGLDAELEELLGELVELEPLLEDELFEEELLEEELLGGDITGGIDTDGIDGVVGMLALGQPVSVITTAVMQQTASAR